MRPDLEDAYACKLIVGKTGHFLELSGGCGCCADTKKRETKMNVHKKDSLVAPEPDEKTARAAAFASYHLREHAIQQRAAVCFRQRRFFVSQSATNLRELLKSLDQLLLCELVK